MSIMLPVLGFFNKTEWRLFPEYSLTISDTNIKLSIEGTTTTLTIENKNLAKTCDEIIDDAIKTEFKIDKTELNNADSIFKELIETYNAPEWIPTILMIDANMNINFNKPPNSTPNSDNLNTNDSTKNNGALISSTTTVSSLPSAPSLDDLPANVITTINGALISSNVAATAATADPPSNVNDMINSAFVSLNERDNVKNSPLTSSDNLNTNVSTTINGALTSSTAVSSLPSAPSSDDLNKNVITTINGALTSSTAVSSLTSADPPSNVNDMINSAFVSLNERDNDQNILLPSSDNLPNDVKVKLNASLSNDDLPTNVATTINAALIPTSTSNTASDVIGLVDSALASLNATKVNDLPTNVATTINAALIPTSTSNTSSNVIDLVDSALASLNKSDTVIPVTSVTVTTADNLPGNVMEKINAVLEPEDSLLGNVMEKINTVLEPEDSLPGNVMEKINTVLEPEDSLLGNVMEKINAVLEPEDVDSLPVNVEKSINTALNNNKGGKRNPDRERVYKLPIQKRRTDNYYNYE